MKIKPLSALLVAIVIISITACSSPLRLFQRGNYYKATIVSVKKLRSKPHDLEAQEVLVKAYPLAVDNIQQSIDGLQHIENPDKYYTIVRYYNMLNTMTTEIARCPKALELVPDATDYSEELQVARQAGAEAYYSMGIELLEQGGIEAARRAVVCFRNTNNFVRGYKDTNRRLSQAKAQSVLQVYIAKPNIDRGYLISPDDFCQSLVGEMNRRYSLHSDINFLSYTYHGVDSYHHAVEIDFVDFYISMPRESRMVTNTYRDSVITGYTNVRGESYPIYSTVRAKFIEHTMEVFVSGYLNVRIVDADKDMVIQSIRIPGEFVWVASWGTYQGDERALTDSQFEMCKRYRPVPPNSQELFAEFSRPLYDVVVEFLTDFYRHY